MMSLKISPTSPICDDITNYNNNNANTNKYTYKNNNNNNIIIIQSLICQMLKQVSNESVLFSASVEQQNSLLQSIMKLLFGYGVDNNNNNLDVMLDKKRIKNFIKVNVNRQFFNKKESTKIFIPNAIEMFCQFEMSPYKYNNHHNQHHQQVLKVTNFGNILDRLVKYFIRRQYQHQNFNFINIPDHILNFRWTELILTIVPELLKIKVIETKNAFYDAEKEEQEDQEQKQKNERIDDAMTNDKIFTKRYFIHYWYLVLFCLFIYLLFNIYFFCGLIICF